MAFVGRERELARLAGALQRAVEGRHGRVVLTGPAGIGITRLLDEFTERLSGLPGIVVARAGALEPGAGEAYQALGAALASALGRLPDERVRDVIGRSGHDLGHLLRGHDDRLLRIGVDRSPPRFSAPDQLGSRVQEAVLGALERLAGDGVLLLALEDLHHADPATRGFVRALLRIGRPLPVCLVLTYQPDELHRRHQSRDLAAALATDPTVEHITVGPLDADGIGRLVGSLQGDRPDSDVLAAVFEGSGGNPLTASQLVAAEQALAGVRLSDPFEQVVGARLEELAPSPRRLVRLLAAARQPLARHRVLAMSLPEGRITVAAIGEAVAGGMVTEHGGMLSIAHELYAEAVGDHELPNERSLLHGVVAEALCAHPARAAWHWEAAAHPQEAREAHLAAAEESVVLDPGETTLFHLQRVLSLTGEAGLAEPRGVAELLERAARATAATGAFRRAAALMRRATEASLTRPEPRQARPRRGLLVPRDDVQRRRVGALVEEIGRFQWAGGDLEGAVRSMERALALMPRQPSPERARAQASLAQHLMLDGRFTESARFADEARETAVAAGDAALPELAHATCSLGVDVAYLGDLERGLALLAEADDIARRTGRLDDLMRVAANRTTLLDLDARREEALAVVADGIRVAEEGGLAGTYGAFLRGNAADILYQLGRWTESEAECRAGMEWAPAGVAWFSPTLYLGLVLVESRADDEAASLIGQIMLQLDTVPAGQWSALVQRAAVSLALWRGQYADAVRVAGREWLRVLETDDPVQVALAAATCLEAAAAAGEQGRADRDIGLVAAATELGDLVMPDAEARVATGALPPGIAARAEADLHLATARAHRARLRGRPSAATWDHLAAAWAARPVPYLAAKSRWWQALTVLQTGGTREQARAAIDEAWRIAAGLPALPLLGALADLAARARLPLPDGATQLLAQARPLVAVAVEPRPRRPMGPGVPESQRRPTAHPEAAPAIADDGSEVGRAIDERIRSTPASPLSPREMAVLRIICEGRTDREIAERLFISERTVHVHVRHVLAKLGVASRTQATALALREGLVPMAEAVRPTR